LKENGDYDDTLIIITSDHGEHFGEHGLWSHAASLYNEVLHIPLIIKFPRGIDHIREVDDCTQLVDIFPTIMEIAGIAEKERINTSGSSLVCSGNRRDRFHEYIFAEWEGRIPYFIQEKIESSSSSRDIHRIANKMWMISEGRYKYMSASDGREELYDLNQDRREQNNLMHQSHEIASLLKAKLNDWKFEAVRETIQERSEMDEETRKNLERLGYM